MTGLTASKMTGHLRGSFETEQGNVNDSMTLVDLEHVEDSEANYESGFVSPTELTKINFRSLIGHTDEVWNFSFGFPSSFVKSSAFNFCFN